MNDTNAASIQCAAVLGAGTMGHGIAHVLAACGVETRLFERLDQMDGNFKDDAIGKNPKLFFSTRRMTSF